MKGRVGTSMVSRRLSKLDIPETIDAGPLKVWKSSTDGHCSHCRSRITKGQSFRSAQKHAFHSKCWKIRRAKRT